MLKGSIGHMKHTYKQFNKLRGALCWHQGSVLSQSRKWSYNNSNTYICECVRYNK